MIISDRRSTGETSSLHEALRKNRLAQNRWVRKVSTRTIALQRDYPAKVRFLPAMRIANWPRERSSPGKKNRAFRKVCTQCGFVLFPGAQKLVAGCLVIDAGKVLLLRRGKLARTRQMDFSRRLT